MKRFVLSLALLLLCAAVAHAQQQTGDIFGKVTDQSGAVLPGRHRHPYGALLLQPLDRGDQRYRHIPVPATGRRHLHREVRARRLQDRCQGRHRGDCRLQRAT